MPGPRPRSMTIVAVLVAACASPGQASLPSGPSGPSGQSASAAPTTAAEGPTAAPSPIAADATPTTIPTAHPGEGIPDPAGRIVFGRIVGEDGMYGSFVALSAIDPDGSDEVQLTKGASGYPAWSPDGTRIAFSQRQADGTWQIATMAADGSDVRVLTSGLGADVASWSPDGRWIAYMRQMSAFDDPDFRTTLWRMNADGSDPRPLGDQDTFDVEPKISPDGTEVVFHRLTFENGDQQQVTIVRDIATGKERTIPITGAEHVNWSPDGKWLVYDRSPNYTRAVVNDQLERIASDGMGQPIILFPGRKGSGGFKPWYSPDGKRIVFGCFKNDASDALCLIDHDGSNLVVLVDSPQHENHFSWGVAAQ